MNDPDRRRIIATIEDTRLRASTTRAEVVALCAGALAHGFKGVCVNPLYVADARRELGGGPVEVVTVVGFPLGCSEAASTAHEAALAVERGADEVDMVVPFGPAVAGELRYVAELVRAVRRAVPLESGKRLKVILETTEYLALERAGGGPPDLLAQVVAAVLGEGPDYLKTSTGFDTGRHEPDDLVAMVKRLKELGHGIRVKASGGIKTAQQAAALVLEAGADALGTSSGVAIAESLADG